MGKSVREKRSAGAPFSGAGDGAETTAPSAIAEAPATGEPGEPLERARLQAEVAKQRLRIAKEELKRARKRVKEAKREAKRARKLSAVARKAWKKARKAYRGDSAPVASAGRRAAAPRARRKTAGQVRGAHRPRKRHANAVAPVTTPSQS